MADADVLVVGGGVIGLSVARSFATSGVATMLLEGEGRCGLGLSTRNSGVIHAGLYYSPDSLKKRLCVNGRDLLYRYAQANGVRYDRCGKYIVATDNAEIERLNDIYLANRHDPNVPLHWASSNEVKEKNADVECLAALYSPLSGVVDQSELLTTLEGEIQAHSGEIVLNTRVHAFEWKGDVCAVSYFAEQDEVLEIITCKRLVIAAGLYTDDILRNSCAETTRGLAPIRYVKGTWYSAHGLPMSFSNLIYPVPTQHGLGVHLTFDTAGSIMFGPDTTVVSDPDFTFDASNKKSFIDSISRYFPKITQAHLEPIMASIRPQVDKDPRDFEIIRGEPLGLGRSVFLRGIESPGLTASLAIGDEVVKCFK